MNTNNLNKKIWLYGKHVTLSILKNQKRHCYQIWLTKKNQENLILPKTNYKYPIYIKQNKDFIKKFGNQSVHQGCAIETTKLKLINIKSTIPAKENSKALFIILDQIKDPQNIGSILRSAAVFKANAVIITNHNTVNNDSTIITKISSGAIEICPLIRINNLQNTLKILKQNKIWICGLDERKNLNNNYFTDIQNTVLPIRIAFLIGSEGKGLRYASRNQCDFSISIPTNNKFSTLNISSASTIALYSFYVQNYIKKNNNYQFIKNF